ncbi:DDRGK domain-containing protein 1-like [Benincasa hispida]|uniref:DDRGK domain-containing protein 1-like n=1 Tax=Benincasa hispida TaxID=102211 RepID=UPI001901E9C2|nr:DDRGK domain-containing protein 1-like [Benincasa hispida]
MEKEGGLPEPGGPIRVALEEAVAEKQPEVVEEEEKKKKKKKIKEKRVKEDEEVHPIKKKERRTGEKRECRREEKRLKKEEERRKRVESTEIDGESTSAKVDKVESAQLRKSAQPEEEITQVKIVATDDGEDSDYPPRRRCKENAPQGSTIDPPILHNAVEEKERRRREKEEK